jgi:acetyl-CoA synthetase (ADP-forming)
VTDLPAPRIGAAGILAPRSVALIGASEDIGKFGGRIMHNLLRHGYLGRVLPINPRRASILGRRAYASVAAAPGPIDLAVVAVPATQLREAVAECAAAGVGACILVTAQTAEFDEAGRVLQEEVTAIARRHGMRLVGPNCMGMINPAARLGLTSSLTLQHVAALRTGRVALASQSGALMATLFMLAHDHGVGFSRMVSVGNQADLDLCDFLEALIDDAETRTICLYIEGLPDAARYVRLARAAAERGKPLLAVKAGRSDSGARAASSHTASLAGSYTDFAAASRAAGVVVLDEPEAMALVAGVLDRVGEAGPGGIGLIVSSGGGGAVTADRLAARGMPLAEYGAATRARLEQRFLPRHVNNPLDLGSHKGALAFDVFADAISAVAESDEVAALFCILTAQPLLPETAALLVDTWRRATKPVVVVLDTGSFAGEARDAFIAAGMPFVTRIDDGLRVLEALFERRRTRARAATPPERPAGAGPACATDCPAGRLDEHAAKRLFATCGIVVTREAPVASLAQAHAAAQSLGYPVVLKGMSPTVVHKSDAGLVELGIADAEALTRAWQRVTAALAATDPDMAPRMLVQEMASGALELIIGARHTAYGPQVMAGAGGTRVEALGDVAFAAAPLSVADARDLIAGLRIAPLFGAWRGRAPLDLEGAADALVRLSWLAADLGERLAELDINPLLVRAIGAGVIAVDGRATLT